MRDINDVVGEITRLAMLKADGKYRSPSQHDPNLVERISRQVHALLVDQLMNVAAAIAPESEAEREIVAWLQGRLVLIAQQLPNDEVKDEIHDRP